MALYGNQRMVEGNVSWVNDEVRKVGENGDLSVFDFGIVSSQRVRDNNGDWKDGEPDFISVTVWGRLANNVAASIDKGTRVIVIGQVRMKNGYTSKKGDEIAPSEYIVADSVGLSLEFATGELTKNHSSSSNSNSSRPSRPNSSSNSSRPKGPDPSQTSSKSEDDDDIDFEDGDDLPF